MPPKNTLGSRSGVAVLTINYRTCPQTLRCLESLRTSETPADRIYVLDNSEIDDGLENALSNLEPFESSELIFIKSTRNLGFAEGSNVLIEAAFKHADCEYVLLLNNDAVAMPGLIGGLRTALSAEPSAGLAGPRVHKLENPDEIDSLGIVLYRSLMPADRYDTREPYLGPSGGCAMITRECLTALKENAGYFFDPRFFCYCEDTDLMLRANLLGYQPAFINEVLALHEGQASSGQGYNAFIAYHGLRNLTWMILKSVPTYLLTRFGFFFVAAHSLWILNHLCLGRLNLIFSVYKDILKGAPLMQESRQKMRNISRSEVWRLADTISPRFYRKEYMRSAIKKIILSFFNNKNKSGPLKFE
jgi:GT2 family glycosyltransferase